MSAITYKNFLTDYVILNSIGCGKTASVQLIEEKRTKLKYALKTIVINDLQ